MGTPVKHQAHPKLKYDRITDKPGDRKYFLHLTTKQGRDETIPARHRSATFRAHKMGLRNYPSRKSQISPQMGRTHFPPFSQWKVESVYQDLDKMRTRERQM